MQICLQKSVVKIDVEKGGTMTLTFKRILELDGNLEKYKEEYEKSITKSQIEEIEKMLECRDPKKGFATYLCLQCGEDKKVPFTCKSRICSSCGKKYADKWAEELSGRLWNVGHRHITFTIAEELWSILEENEEWRKELFKAANATLREVMEHKAGVVLTLHPYGKDMKVNYHIHALVTEGGIDKNGQWRSQPFIPYKKLRKVWQYEILTRLGAVMPKEYKYIKLINDLFMRYKDGFYVNAEPKVKDGKGVGKYIGRYLRHPAIADSRILSYDGEYVTFSYKDRSGSGKAIVRVKKVPVLEFIHGVVRHIPPKQFKMVRYYGLYAPRKKEKVKQLMQQIGSMLGRAVRKLTWRERRMQTFGQDPLTCPKCGERDMVLYSLTVPDGNGLKTIGGRSWLFARGDWLELPEEGMRTTNFGSHTFNEPQTSPIQLSFDFTVAA